jgi:hypothetical protein
MGGIIQLPAGWGEVEIRADAPRIPCAQSPGPRAYDHLGNRLSWFPSAVLGVRKFACDVEDCSRDVSFMAAQFGVAPAQFHERWVASEVLAKLADTPILEWLKTYGLFACETGVPVRAEIPCSRAELMVLADGARMMAFGFVS